MLSRSMRRSLLHFEVQVGGGFKQDNLFLKASSAVRYLVLDKAGGVMKRSFSQRCLRWRRNSKDDECD
ncbi:hypothetical protein CBOM_07389 [Ceraceosorus bombacis]|uniref:Uncharacterized protein n=1 Tax=Ceraceosorus bombacis TaxID=401625 RepID=A0A0P1BAE4_9BASI|nr:hypothetical protein CBOM_07389 [Ceraceosorus bombacis]